MADRVPTMDRSMNIALVDSTEENREKTFFGMDPERLNQVWDEIRKMEISAGTAMRKPYQNEKSIVHLQEPKRNNVNLAL